ncbi:MAG: DUF192 domain-containing protein [Anaerolineae bacterium]|nr:DUF192 domain-containing protein [Anaerolineae bacterium]
MLVNRTTGQTLASRVRHCATYWSRLRGLMFRRTLGPDQAYVFWYRRESIAQTSIHMFFVFQTIAVVWLDAERRVVDAVRARPFCPYYASRIAAQYIVEAAPALLDRVSRGDELAFQGDGR